MNKNSRGFTLIEVAISIAVFAIIATAVFGVYNLIIKQISAYRDKTTVAFLAAQYMEIARNMAYSKIGTVEGNPSGELPDLPNAYVLNFGGNDYLVYYAVSYVDDIADGTILEDSDPAPTDYKQIKLYIKNNGTGTVTDFTTNMSPKGLEDMVNGGALYISVIDAVGQPVPGALIHITNSQTNPTIDITRTSGQDGKWIEVGLPESANSYHIEVSKQGFSLDQTYPLTPENPNPVKPDSTVLAGEVTRVNFDIDKLSNLYFFTLGQTCSPLENIDFNVKSQKLIGLPNVYKLDNIYQTNSSGSVSLQNIEWDVYTPTLLDNNYMVYGSSPIQQISLLPDTSQNFTLILGPATNNALLVIVKDSSDNSALEGVYVELASTGIPANCAIASLAGQGGLISPSGDIAVSRGSDKTFSISANAGYSVKQVWVDGFSVGQVASYTFNDIEENHSIYASFEQN